jgi:phosphoglycerate dehydrogenase-like enzyme
MGSFRVAVTRDVLNPAGELFFDDLGFDLLDLCPSIDWEILPEPGPELPPRVTADYDAVLMFGSRLTVATLAGGDRLSLVARAGVGHELIDVEACTAAGIAVTITPEAVRRSTALGALTLLLASVNRLLPRSRMAAAGRWADRSTVRGMGLTGRTLGILGYGNIGRELSRLARPLETRQLAYTRTPPAAPGPDDPEFVSLARVLSESDVICLCLPLTSDTARIIDAAALELVKPHAHLVNIGRGELIDEAALVSALGEGRLAAAALDVLADEPPRGDNPLLSMEGVIVTPHCIAHSDELLRGCGHLACGAAVDLAAGRVPGHLVDPAVLEDPRFRRRLRPLCDATSGPPPPRHGPPETDRLAP